ncbi:MAG: phosphoribosylglycinamide formyltransferase [Candidatus Omnitrophica bacterium]|nr:phosphoribosylglycinamide formyltransferase [Candidatus Omnitrophota bacterium]
MKFAVLASGNGSNFEVLARSVRSGSIPAELALLLSDKKNAYVRQRARNLQIPEQWLNPQDFPDRRAYDQALKEILTREGIDFVALAGYMRILSAEFVRSYPNKIMNIHPALLPSFPGTDSLYRAYRHGCKVTGVTVHFVDEQVDHGPIILQQPLLITPGMTYEELETRVHEIEHQLYPHAVRLYAAGKLLVKKNHVEIAE